MGRNIEKVKKLLAGVGGQGTPRIGYTGKTIHMRKEGEIWEEPSGRKYVKEDGKRKQITKVPSSGFRNCIDCNNLILKTIDTQTYNRFQRCKYCQLEFEAKLKREDKWVDWVKEMEAKRWEAVLAEYEAEMDELKESKSPFDKTIANALGNHELGK